MNERREGLRTGTLEMQIAVREWILETLCRLRQMRHDSLGRHLRQAT